MTLQCLRKGWVGFSSVGFVGFQFQLSCRVNAGSCELANYDVDGCGKEHSEYCLRSGGRGGGERLVRKRVTRFVSR